MQMRDKLINYIKQIDGYSLLLSFLFSTMLIMSCHVFYTPHGNSTVETTFVTDFHVLDIAGILILIPLIYSVIKALLYMLKSVNRVVWTGERQKRILVFMGYLIFIFVMWIPYLFSYRPGGIYSDTVDSLDMALGNKTMENHHPVLYTLTWRFVFWLSGVFRGENVHIGLNNYTILQTLLLAGALAGFLYYLYKKGIHKLVLTFLLILFAIYPLYPYYGISLWKDTIFSVAFFLFCLFLYDVFGNNPEDITWKQLASYGILSMLVMFLRNNGIYIALFYSVGIVLLCLKNRRSIAKKIGIISVSMLVVAWIIQGPLFDKAGYNIDKATESLGIPIQQTAFILSTNGNTEGVDLEFLDTLMPLENWQALYNPVVVDTIKFDPSFDRAFLEENYSEFVRTYLQLVIKNPVKAVKAYLLQTMGFWNVFESDSTAYICNVHFGNAMYYMSDYFDYLFDISFHDMVAPKNYLSAAIFVWGMIVTIFICLKKRYYAGMIPLLPMFGLWITIMIATPVAFSFRYIYGIFLCVPLYVLISLRACREEK